MVDIEKTPISPIETYDETITKGEVSNIPAKEIHDAIHDDMGRVLFEQSLQYDTAQLELDGVKVRRKLDFIVLPMVSSYSFDSTVGKKLTVLLDDDNIHAQFLRQADVSCNIAPLCRRSAVLSPSRLNYSNAYGLQADTHMTGTQYSWVASALYFGWLVGAYPSNLALQRLPVGRFVGGMLFVWGAMCMLQAAVFNFWLLCNSILPGIC